MPKQPKRAAGPAEHDDEADEQSADAVQTAKKGKSSPPARDAASKSRASSRDLEDEDDEDDDDEDDDVEEEEVVRPSARKPSASKRVAPAKGAKVAPRRRAAPQLPPEDEIDAPKKQTLWMLGALAIAICVMWGASRFACNAHPMQTRKPREVSTAELARDPKGAALELAQRWASYDFAGALELASGSVAAEIQKAKQQCDADQAACDNKRKELADKVLATAVLLSREGERAKARVSTDGGATGKETYVLELAREGALWKGVSKSADTGAPPARAPEPAPAPSAPAPAASP